MGWLARVAGPTSSCQNVLAHCCGLSVRLTAAQGVRSCAAVVSVVVFGVLYCAVINVILIRNY